jgi:hypothetical protein
MNASNILYLVKCIPRLLFFSEKHGVTAGKPVGQEKGRWLNARAGRLWLPGEIKEIFLSDFYLDFRIWQDFENQFKKILKEFGHENFS